MQIVVHLQGGEADVVAIEGGGPVAETKQRQNPEVRFAQRQTADRVAFRNRGNGVIGSLELVSKESTPTISAKLKDRYNIMLATLTIEFPVTKNVPRRNQSG